MRLAALRTGDPRPQIRTLVGWCWLVALGAGSPLRGAAAHETHTEAVAPRDALRSRVAIVRAATDDRLIREASTRLWAELAAAGFETVTVDRRPGDDVRGGVEALADATQSFATIAIERAGEGAYADVWIGDRVTGKTVVRRLNVGNESNAATVLAIRSLELLRASLLELATPRSGSSRSEPPPADVLDWVEPALPVRRTASPWGEYSLALGGLGLHSFEGLGPAVGPSARLTRGFSDAGFARLTLAAPLVARSVKERAGKARVDQHLAGLDVGWTRSFGPVAGYAWAGLGAFYLRVKGVAEAPYEANRDGALSVAGQAGVGGVWRLGSGFSAWAELSALGVTPRPIVVIAGRDVASMGAPSVGGATGLCVEL